MHHIQDILLLYLQSIYKNTRKQSNERTKEPLNERTDQQTKQVDGQTTKHTYQLTDTINTRWRTAYIGIISHTKALKKHDLCYFLNLIYIQMP